MIHQLQGLAASPGAIVASACVVSTLAEAQSRNTNGAVLVVPALTPHWLPCILSCAAVVAERGGRTSHAATLCRELGRPCVTGLSGATRLIPDGAPILVDGTLGVVQILME
jgi:pyruvate,water dikinase